MIDFIRVIRMIRWVDHVTSIKTWEICNFLSKTWRDKATWLTSWRKEGKGGWDCKGNWFWGCEVELCSPRKGLVSGCYGNKFWWSITLKFSHISHLVSSLKKKMIILKEKLGCGEQTMIKLHYSTWSVTQPHKQIFWWLQTTTQLLLAVVFEQYGRQHAKYQSGQYEFHEYLYFRFRC